MINHDNKYDSDIVEFINTIDYLSGGSTVNFLRGPMFHGQRRGGGGGGEGGKQKRRGCRI